MLPFSVGIKRHVVLLKIVIPALFFLLLIRILIVWNPETVVQEKYWGHLATLTIVLGVFFGVYLRYYFPLLIKKNVLIVDDMGILYYSNPRVIKWQYIEYVGEDNRHVNIGFSSIVMSSYYIKSRTPHWMLPRNKVKLDIETAVMDIDKAELVQRLKHHLKHFKLNHSVDPIAHYIQM